MKKIRINKTIILVVMVVILAAALAFNVYQRQLLNKKIMETRAVVEAVFDLNIVTIDYLIYRQDFIQQKWYDKYQALSELLSKSAQRFSKPADKLILETIRNDHQDLEEAFSRLIAMNTRVNGSDYASNALIGRILVKSRLIVANALQLPKSSVK